MADPWVQRCPNGHTSVFHRHTNDESWCLVCDLRWRGSPIDAREVDEFPIADSEYEVVQ